MFKMTSALLLIGVAFVSLDASAESHQLADCVFKLKSPELAYEAKKISNVLRLTLDDFRTSDTPTIAFEGNFDGFMSFKKLPGYWLSETRGPSGVTPQGDNRTPMFLLGPDLSAEIGTTVDSLGGGRYRLRIPGPRILGQVITETNFFLSQVAEPISFKPVSAGFVNNQEILDLAAERDGDALLKFAVAEFDKFYSGHDAAFHLNLLYSKAILSRANEITQLTKQFLEFIRETHSNFDFTPILDDYVLSMRTSELDTGTANSTYFLAFARQTTGMKPYSQILEVYDARVREGRPHPGILMDWISEAIDELAHPEFTPLEAVLENIIWVSKLKLDPSAFDRFKLSEKIWARPESEKKSPVSLTRLQKRQLTKILTEFIQSLGPQYLTRRYVLETSAQMTRKWIAGLDARIFQIRGALSQVREFKARRSQAR